MKTMCLAIDANVISTTLHFENTKTARWDFQNSIGGAVSFTKAPRVQITALDTSAAPAYKCANVKTGALYTGVIVGFNIPVTIDVELQIQERA